MHLFGSSVTTSSSCFSILSLGLQFHQVFISKLLVKYSKEFSVIRTSNVYHLFHLAPLSPLFSLLFPSLSLGTSYSTSYITAAFMLAPRHPGLEVKILYCCTIYRTVQYKVHKSTSTCRECMQVTVHARYEQTYMIWHVNTFASLKAHNVEGLYVADLMYIFFPLMAMAGSSRTMLNNMARVDILVLFLILEEMHSDFHHWVWC